GGNTFGRLTLQIQRDNRPGMGESAWGVGSDAWARELTETLYRTILHAQASGREARMDYERIRSYGQQGAVDVAVALARTADQQGYGRSGRGRGYEDEDVQRVGSLYRSLLKRQQTIDEMWHTDRGFSGNVRLLHDRGLVPLVETIVGSDEFRT